MTDTDTTGAAGNGDGQAQTGPALQITAQYLKDLSFESPNAVQLMAMRQPPQVQVQVDVKANPVEGGRQTEVVLHLRCDAKVDDLQAFIIEAEYAALVVISAALPRERQAAALMIEVPTMMFPFARAIIAEASRDGGFPPLLIQPIDFVSMFRRQIAALRDRVSAGEETPAAAGPTEN